MNLSDIVYRIVDAYDGPGMDGLAVSILQAALAEAWREGGSEARSTHFNRWVNPYDEVSND